MDFAATLFSLMAAGAALAATEAAKTFGKSAVTDAYEALKDRLVAAHGAKTLGLIEHAETNTALEPAIKADLANPEIERDGEVKRLAQTLEAAIEALPEAAKAPYAVRIREIRAGRDLLFRDVEGVEADLVTSEGNMTFEGMRAPRK